MARQVKLDLRGAPPVTGGMRDHITPGEYRIRVVKVEDTTSRSGKRMWTGSYKVSTGEHQGANLGDNFVLVDNSNLPSKMGLGRLHHFLLCLGLPVKEAVINFDLDRLENMECIVEVADGEFTDNSGSKRITSEVRGYRPLPSQNGNSATAQNEPETEMSTPEPEPVETPEPEEEVSTEALAEAESEIEDIFK